MTQNIVETPKIGSPELAQRAQEIVPPVDIYENEHELLVLADLPRVTAENLTVEVHHPEAENPRASAQRKPPERHCVLSHFPAGCIDGRGQN